VRYRTAAILSAILVGGMFGLPEAISAVFSPSLGQGIPTPLPAYERVLLGIAVFCFRFRWVLALPIVGVVVALFAVAGFTSAMRAPRRGGTHPNSTIVVS
jgi:hypothetical protein